MNIFDEKDFHTIRKNLNVLSVTIMIMAIANVEVEVLNLLGIEVKLDGEGLYTKGFWHEFITFYTDSPSGVRKQHTYERHRDAFLAHNPELAILESDANTRLIDMKVHRIFQSIRKLRLSAIFYVTVSHANAGPMDNNLVANLDIVVTRIFILRKLLLFSLLHDKFGDYLFPLTLVLLNVVFFVLKTDWQGNLFSLLH
jgi:hypothetical protein